MIEGWLEDVEQEALIAHSKGRTVLEIGTYHGKSTFAMAQLAKLVFSVDPHDGIPGTGPSWTAFLNHLAEKDSRNIIPLRMTSEEATKILTRPAFFDMLFIDGDHSYEAVMFDLSNWVPYLAKGAIIAVHDYGDPAHRGVTRAVNDYNPGTHLGTTNHLWIGRK